MREHTEAARRIHPGPVVAVLQDDTIRAGRLRQVLERLRCRVIDVFPNAGDEELERIRLEADLIAAPVDSRRPDTVERIRLLSVLPRSAGSTPVLALVRPDDVAQCLDGLREAGVAGLLSCDASLAHIEFRLNGLLDVFPERRRNLRASILLPVDLVCAGVVSRECGVSLSIAGIGIASRRPLEPNAEVQLQLHTGPTGPIELKGRVIHCLQETASLPPFRIGVYFQDPPLETRRRLEMLIDTAE